MATWNEWDPLEEVIVGNIYKPVLPGEWDRSVKSINYVGENHIPKFGSYPKRVIEETEEDLEALVSFLRSENVIVHRPENRDHQIMIKTPNWVSTGYYNYCPRDTVFTYGNNIIETPVVLRNRYFESESMRYIFNGKIDEGYKLFSAPKPLMKDECYIDNPSKTQMSLTEIEPMFDAANCLKCGEDIFYLRSNTGNNYGARWLKSMLPETKIHVLDNIYAYIHIDSTISLLRPGLVLLNPERINERNMPKQFEKWDKIISPYAVDIGHHPKICHASKWIGINLLMVRPDLAIVDSSQAKLIRMLERLGIMVKPLTLRHARTLGGGFHCVTLDLKRKSSKENYF